VQPMQLDLPTLYFLLLAMQALFAVVHALVWRANPDAKALIFWVASNLIGCITALLVMLVKPDVGIASTFTAAVVGNVLFILTYLIQWSGVRYLLGKQIRPERCAAVLILPSILLVALYSVDAPYWARATLVSALLALLAGIQLRDLLSAPSIMGISLIRATTLLHLSFYAWRVVYFVDLLPSTPLSAGVNTLTGWTLFEALICLVAANVSYLMILSERRARSLNHLALTDPLTGLLNRRAFVEQTALVAARGGTMLLLDIDRFKHVNDVHGHATGDKVLIGFADLLRLQLRSHDIIARTGGEEFSIVLPGLDVEPAKLIAERIRQACAETNFATGLEITVSIGIASLRAEETLVSTTARADVALYAAKNNGRNRIELAAV
jgi:diguanylate cyclase (GGDEF)-like protein